MLLAALRRLVLVVLLCVAVTGAASLLVGVLIGAALDRALALGFYLMGCFLLLAGFFVGNRGPARVKSESAAAVMIPFPGVGERRLRWATLVEQNEAINSSAIFVTIGVILVLVGVVIDTRHSVF
jgi:hypothetical protein